MHIEESGKEPLAREYLQVGSRSDWKTWFHILQEALAQALEEACCTHGLCSLSGARWDL